MNCHLKKEGVVISGLSGFPLSVLCEEWNRLPENELGHQRSLCMCLGWKNGAYSFVGKFAWVLDSWTGNWVEGMRNLDVPHLPRRCCSLPLEGRNGSPMFVSTYLLLNLRCTGWAQGLCRKEGGVSGTKQSHHLTIRRFS